VTKYCVTTSTVGRVILKNASNAQNTRKARQQMPALLASSDSSKLMLATAAKFDRWHQKPIK